MEELETIISDLQKQIDVIFVGTGYTVQAGKRIQEWEDNVGIEIGIKWPNSNYRLASFCYEVWLEDDIWYVSYESHSPLFEFLNKLAAGEIPEPDLSCDESDVYNSMSLEEFIKSRAPRQCALSSDTDNDSEEVIWED